MLAVLLAVLWLSGCAQRPPESALSPRRPDVTETTGLWVPLTVPMKAAPPAKEETAAESDTEDAAAGSDTETPQDAPSVLESMQQNSEGWEEYAQREQQRKQAMYRRVTSLLTPPDQQQSLQGLTESSMLNVQQQQVSQAEEAEGLSLQGLQFAERCALLMLWKQQQEIRFGHHLYSLIDLTQDGVPELVLHYMPGIGNDPVVIYDLSGAYVRSIGGFITGYTDEKFDGTIFAPFEPTGKRDSWRCYATVFLDGTPGGIIETCGVIRTHFTFYFTYDPALYPLDNMLEVGQVYVGLNARRRFCGTLGTVNLEGEHKISFQSIIDYTDEGSPLLSNEQQEWFHMTEEEYLEAVKGTCFETLYRLPHLPWPSPMVTADEWVLKEDSTPADVWQTAQALCTEYNRQLEEGDYDLPLVS